LKKAWGAQIDRGRIASEHMYRVNGEVRCRAGI
jgi:hypothetical protein